VFAAMGEEIGDDQIDEVGAAIGQRVGSPRNSPTKDATFISRGRGGKGSRRWRRYAIPSSSIRSGRPLRRPTRCHVT
jgi:hypothetical protein